MISGFFENKYRIINGIVIIVSVMGSYSAIDCIFEGKELSNFDYFSYYGTVFTLLSFFVALLEILHSSSHTLSVNKKTELAVSRLLDKSYTTSRALLLEQLDQLHDCVLAREYKLAQEKFRNIRRCVMGDEKLVILLKNKILEFNSIERRITSFRELDGKANMTNSYLNQIRGFILEVKVLLEKGN